MRSLPDAAGERCRGIDRREDRDPSQIPQASDARCSARPARATRVRVRPSRHRVVDRGVGRSDRQGHRRSDGTQRLGALHRVPRPARGVDRSGLGDPPRDRQRQFAPLESDQEMVGRALTIRRPSHPGPRLVVEPGRSVLLDPHPQGATTRRVRLTRRPRRQGARLHRAPQPDRPTVQLVYDAKKAA